MKTLWLGCTVTRHARLGIEAVINARAGRQDLNNQTEEEIRQERDARAIRDRIERRVRFYQFQSRFFRRHQRRFAHLVSSYDEDL